MPAIAALLKRLGPLSPVSTLQTFAPGARSLIREAERSGELALHVVRAVWWAVVVATTFQWFGVSGEVLLVNSAWLGALWVLTLFGLRSARAFTVSRYVTVVADAWIVIGVGVVLSGPLAPFSRDMAERFGSRIPDAVELQAYVAPLLVYLALTGALRLDPRVAALSGGFAVLGAALYAASATERGPALLVLGIVILSAIVAANAARVVRYVVLKATAGAIYESFVPESLSRDLTQHGALERGGRVEDVTLLVCDIRGFTKLSERLSPSETVTLVNSYLDAVCPPITASGGVIDKFMGDGVLAFFEGGGNASRALGAARQIVDAVERLRLAGGQLRVGVALHSGEVLVGTVGPRTRREYTIISDAVNTVSRLEELNKTYGSRIVASDATMARIAEGERAGFDGPVSVAIRGRESAIRVFVHGAAAPLGDDGDVGDRLRRFVGREEG